MAGDKRKGKAVAEPKKKTRQEKEWDRVLSVPDTQGQSQWGIRIGERAQSQGEKPQGEQQQQQQTQHQQQLRHSGRGQPAEQTESPPSLARSGPRTRGGHTQPQPTPRQRRAAVEEHTEREQQAVYLRDLRDLPGPKIRRLWSVPEEQWFPRGRDDGDPRFWTVLQESFYVSYVHRGSQLSQHKMLQFTALRAAAAGEAILPFFDYQWGLMDLVTRRSRYVPDWVRVFYATVYIEADRLSIRFMFMGQQQRLTREEITELLQVDLHDDSIHYLAYPDVEPPHRAHSPVSPSNEEISFLFQQPFLPGTPRTPDRLIREAYVVHYALRRSVLYRMGNAESLTGVQQWLLMYVMANHPFDIVDIMLAETEDAIMDGMGRHVSSPSRTGSAGCCPV
jgi:hypothetical protein